MDFVPLTSAQRQSFDADGFLVVRDALDAGTLCGLREAADRLAGNFLTKPQILDKPEYNHLDLRPGLLREPPLLDLVAHSSTVPLIVQLMSPNIHLHSVSLNFKRPESASVRQFRRGWHRDIRIPRDLGHRHLPLVGIKVCYCLTDFHQPNSGMTLFARGSHVGQEPLAVGPRQGDSPDFESCDLQVNAGDAVFFENRIYHTSVPNLSDRTSKVLIYGYAYRWMKPEVYLDIPDERLLAKSDAVTRQLLGEYRDVDTPPWALQQWAKRHGVLPDAVPWTVEAQAP